jgi:putative oxidoreductase
MGAPHPAGLRFVDRSVLPQVNRFFQSARLTRFAAIGLRVALAAGFLSAVADRFGLWGMPGTPGVAWGDWSHFLTYTGKLNWFLPSSLIPMVGAVATLAETALALLLLIGAWPRCTALASGVLLLLFALAMTFALGIKAPLGYSVYVGATAAFYLAATAALPQRS